MKGRALLKHMGTALAGTALAALVAFALPASANIYNFSTPSGALSFDGKPLDASAQFTTSAGQIELILTNLQATSVASQLLSDISFTASSVNGGGGSILPSSASYINVASDGTRTSAGAQNLPWTLTNTELPLQRLGAPGRSGLDHRTVDDGQRVDQRIGSQPVHRRHRHVHPRARRRHRRHGDLQRGVLVRHRRRDQRAGSDSCGGLAVRLRSARLDRHRTAQAARHRNGVAGVCLNRQHRSSHLAR